MTEPAAPPERAPAAPPSAGERRALQVSDGLGLLGAVLFALGLVGAHRYDTTELSTARARLPLAYTAGNAVADLLGLTATVLGNVQDPQGIPARNERYAEEQRAQRLDFERRDTRTWERFRQSPPAGELGRRLVAVCAGPEVRPPSECIARARAVVDTELVTQGQRQGRAFAAAVAGAFLAVLAALLRASVWMRRQ